MPHFTERRRQPRRLGEGLILLIDGRAFPVLDISVAGISFQATGYKPNDRIAATLTETANPAAGVETSITVRAVGNGVVRGEFYPTNKLMRFIMAHVGEVTGGAPSYFR